MAQPKTRVVIQQYFNSRTPFVSKYKAIPQEWVKIKVFFANSDKAVDPHSEIEGMTCHIDLMCWSNGEHTYLPLEKRP